MTVKVMSYRVLRQHILRFGYVRIKRRNENCPHHRSIYKACTPHSGSQTAQTNSRRVALPSPLNYHL